MLKSDLFLKMSADDVNSVADQLAKTSVDESKSDLSQEISFAGQGIKLDKEEDGKFANSMH